MSKEEYGKGYAVLHQLNKQGHPLAHEPRSCVVPKYDQSPGTKDLLERTERGQRNDLFSKAAHSYEAKKNGWTLVQRGLVPTDFSK